MSEIIKFKHTGENSRGTFEYRQERARNYIIERNYDRIMMRKAMKDYRRAINKLDLESLMNAQWTDLMGSDISEEARVSIGYIDEYIGEQIGEEYKSQQDDDWN